MRSSCCTPDYRAALVALLLAFVPPLGWATDFPWKPGDAPPVVCGVRLGDDRAHLEQALGSADDIQDLAPDSYAFFFRQRGLIVLYSSHEGVNALYLLQPQTGDIDGIHVGDVRESVLAKWGAPSVVEGAEARYRAGDWVIGLQLGPEQTVARLELGRPIDREGHLP